jgi:GT2 family glycosyltransferase
VESLAGAEDTIADIIVVDNGSPEPMSQRFSSGERVEVLRCRENVGFAQAANLGARSARGDFLLFLNPDVRLRPAELVELVETIDGGVEIGAVAPNLLQPDGVAQIGAGGYLPTLRSVSAHSFLLPKWLPGGFDKPFMIRFDRFDPTSSNGDRQPRPELVPVDWLSGACLLVRRSAFEEVGGFDGSFFLYGEDIDLGRRLRESGRQVVMRPDLAVWHLHFGNDASRSRAPATAWIDGLDDYYRQHAPRSRRVLHAIGGLGLLGRAAARGLGAALPGSSFEARDRAARLLSYARRSIALSVLPRG